MRRLLCLLTVLLPPAVEAHPLPDIPVRGFFPGDGTVMIRVEMDPRCFTAEPENEAYLMKIQLEKLMTEQDKEALEEQTAGFVEGNLEFFYEPQGAFRPEFTWAFTTLGGGALVKIDDPVVLTGTWQGKVPAGQVGYAVRAKETVRHAVVFENHLHGKAVERTAVLFPGERSFTLALEAGKVPAPAESPPPCCAASGEDVPVGWRKWGQSAALLAAVAVLLRFTFFKGRPR